MMFDAGVTEGEFRRFESVDAVTFIWTIQGQMFDPSVV